jgi:hypothetical protein
MSLTIPRSSLGPRAAVDGLPEATMWAAANLNGRTNMTTPPKDNRYQVSDPDVIRANFAADDGWRIVCRECGLTPQDIGWCEQCGYNRPYEKVRAQPLS